jgi:hypothetical protein
MIRTQNNSVTVCVCVNVAYLSPDLLETSGNGQPGPTFPELTFVYNKMTLWTLSLVLILI